MLETVIGISQASQAQSSSPGIALPAAPELDQPRCPFPPSVTAHHWPAMLVAQQTRGRERAPPVHEHVQASISLAGANASHNRPDIHFAREQRKGCSVPSHRIPKWRSGVPSETCRNAVPKNAGEFCHVGSMS